MVYKTGYLAGLMAGLPAAPGQKKRSPEIVRSAICLAQEISKREPDHYIAWLNILYTRDLITI